MHHIMIEIYQNHTQILLSTLDSIIFVMARYQNSDGQRRHGFSDYERQKFVLTTKNTPAYYNESLLAGQATSSIARLINYSFAGVDIISLPNFDFGCIYIEVLNITIPLLMIRLAAKPYRYKGGLLYLKHRPRPAVHYA